MSFALDNAEKYNGKGEEAQPQADDGCATKSNISKRQRKRAKQKAGKIGGAEQEGASVSESQGAQGGAAALQEGAGDGESEIDRIVSAARQKAKNQTRQNDQGSDEAISTSSFSSYD